MPSLRLEPTGSRSIRGRVFGRFEIGEAADAFRMLGTNAIADPLTKGRYLHIK